VSVQLQVRFPVDDAELSALHRRTFGPGQPETDAAIRPWARRLERHSLTWVGAFSAGRLVGFVHVLFRVGCDWVHVDYEPEYVSFYERACGFRPNLSRPPLPRGAAAASPRDPSGSRN
jgi:hypothetical protein